MNTLEEQLRTALSARAEAVTESMLTLSLPAPGAGPLPEAPVVPLPEPRPHRSRRAVATVLAVAAVLLVAFGAVALHRATSDKTLGPAHVHPRSAIPWSKVGPAWTLVQQVPTLANGRSDAAAAQQLQLVGPDGDRYEIISLPARMDLVDWDGKNRHALLVRLGSTVDPTEKIEDWDLMVVDLVNGSQHTFAAPGYYLSPRFDGSAGQYVTYVSGLHRVKRYSLTGQPRQPVSPVPSSELVADSPDGRQAIVDGRSGLDVYDYASGQRVGNLPPPAGYAGCYDPRWGNDGKLSASCLQKADRTKQTMFVFSVNGRPAAGRADSQYSSIHPGPNANPFSFRQGVVALSYSFVQQPQPSGSSLRRMTATRFDADGRPTSIQVPSQLHEGQWVIVSTGPDDFTVLNITDLADKPATAVLSWNPFTGQVTELVQAARREGFTVAVPWGAHQP